MKLPSLSSSMYVARLRYIQSIREPLERRNPDTLVRHFIPFVERWRAAWSTRATLARLRAEPFYYYLIARTRHYDAVITEAVAEGVKRIVMVGCGSDTRAYRFQTLLRSQGVKVLECDQVEAIHIKEQMARRWHPADYVEYLAIDLNEEKWPKLERWLGGRTGPKTLVMLEGVCGYINDRNYRLFLQLLAGILPVGSQLAYDYKIRGIKDDFGRVGRTEIPFRLSDSRAEVEAFHQAYGLRLGSMELGSQLCTRLLPGLNGDGTTVFQEDALLRLQIGGV